MPQFVPVYDPERPRAEQTDEDETIFHRKWDAPHQLHSRPVGVSDRGNFARMAGRKGGLIQNEKGLWVPPDKVRKAEVAAEANKIDALDVFPSHRPFRKKERERQREKEAGSDSSGSGSSDEDSTDSEESVKPDGTKLSVDTQDPDAVYELASKAAAIAKEKLSKNPYRSKVETRDEFDYQPPKSKSSATTSAELVNNSPFVALCDDVGEQSAAVKKKIRDAQKKKKKKKSKHKSISNGSVSKTIKKKKKDGSKKDKAAKEAKKARKEKQKLIGAAMQAASRSTSSKLASTRTSKNEATDFDKMASLGLPMGFG